ncbi:fibronectin type 3 and ankyrin repeat domains protein 1 isoform X2 [Balaenoptera musculus]|uniref:Fibronectin type 3 and ankyrin repeat domains protein 1 isoform X2 n=1 Tax=Balaenoptera musculus TaxID=9771 RepID=A0A8B8VFT9_BALMU|nr:fibronectin type 3 and ankyrin repeat domains protein 1 isoform X2 [Balaenoptera musculus]
MHGPTDRRTPRVADGGPAGPQPKARAPAPPGARRPPGRARPPDQASGAESLQPATPPPPSLGASATRGSSRPPALPRGFWSLPLAVLLAPPPPPSGLSGQPERRRPWRRGFRRGGGGGGGGSGGSARGAPGAADHGAPEGYATKHVVEGLDPRTLYRFRLKVTSPSGEHEYSPVVSVSTTREPISSEHLHRAVNVNDEDLLLRILQGGNVKVDVPNKFGFTALMVAAQRGYSRLVKILVSNGTDVNLQNGSGKDSLMLACYAGHLDVVKYLRRHGASWDTRDLGGCTALHWAADGGHCNVIEWMIKDGCEVDTTDAGSGWTPLMRVSAVSGNQKVASLLIDAGADVNMKDKDGKTPLMLPSLCSGAHAPILQSHSGPRQL